MDQNASMPQVASTYTASSDGKKVLRLGMSASTAAAWNAALVSAPRVLAKAYIAGTLVVMMAMTIRLERSAARSVTPKARMKMAKNKTGAGGFSCECRYI